MSKYENLIGGIENLHNFCRKEKYENDFENYVVYHYEEFKSLLANGKELTVVFNGKDKDRSLKMVKECLFNKLGLKELVRFIMFNNIDSNESQPGKYYVIKIIRNPGIKERISPEELSSFVLFNKVSEVIQKYLNNELKLEKDKYGDIRYEFKINLFIESKKELSDVTYSYFKNKRLYSLLENNNFQLEFENYNKESGKVKVILTFN